MHIFNFHPHSLRYCLEVKDWSPVPFALASIGVACCGIRVLFQSKIRAESRNALKYRMEGRTQARIIGPLVQKVFRDKLPLDGATKNRLACANRPYIPNRTDAIVFFSVETPTQHSPVQRTHEKAPEGIGHLSQRGVVSKHLNSCANCTVVHHFDLPIGRRNK